MSNENENALSNTGGASGSQPQGAPLKKFLEESGFIINFPLSVLEGGLSGSRMPAFLLRGPAGVGKTELTRLVAQWLGARYVFYQCTLNSSEDDLLYRYVPDENTKSGIRVLPSVLPQALVKSKRHKVVLVLDEFDKTRPSTDALLLDFLQNVRVSARFEGEEVIEGNSQNLVVFLTSNDMREFSEPLLRRVISLHLNPLSTSDVSKLLKAFGFSEELVKLLVQIYTDTHQAGLRKPATIQELLLLGEIIQKHPEEDLTTLLRAVVIKYDDDWELYKQYLPQREQYKQPQEEVEDISLHYVNLPQQPQQQPKQQEQLQTTVQQILESLKVVQPSFSITPQSAQDEETVYLKAIDDERQAYTSVIKSLIPEPTDDPTRFGKFELKLEMDGKPFVTSTKPITFEELQKISVKGEGYAEFPIVYEPRWYVERLLEKANVVKYYTSSTVAVQINKNDTVIVIRYDINKNVVSLYFKGLSDDVKKFLFYDIANDIEDYFWSFEKCASEAIKLREWRPISRNTPIVVLQSSDPDKIMWKINHSTFKLFIGSKYPQLQRCKTWGDVLKVLGVEQ
jgi:MoxR-like ATPase